MKVDEPTVPEAAPAHVLKKTEFPPALTKDLYRIANRFQMSRLRRSEAAKYHNKKGKGLSWRQQNLDRVYLDGFHLFNPDFTGSSSIVLFARGGQYWRAKFDECNLWAPFFLKSDLRWASFKGATLIYPRFWRSNLHGVDFSGAKIYGGNFKDANLDGCNFKDAKLEGCIHVSLIQK